MHILLIEDEVDMARYLVKSLQELGHTVVHASDAVTGTQLALKPDWDVLVVDRMLPNRIDGLKVIQATRDAGNNVPVLVLSALSSLDERIRGLREGGDDYLTKPFALPELIARLDALARRSNEKLKEQTLTIDDLVLDLRTRKARRGSQTINLQPREFRLLEYLVLNKGKIVTRSMLLKSVWDIYFDPGTNVIDVQVSRLRNKLDKGHVTPLLHTIRGIGYRLGISE
jgi:two-component system OmpR family response regulator